MNKAQIFSMDAFLSILGITIILGLVTSQFSVMYDQYSENHFERLDSIASDMANIAVSNIMAKQVNGVKRTSVIEAGKLTEFVSFLGTTLGDDYGGFVKLEGNQRKTVNGGCESTQMQAIEKRLVLVSGNVGWLQVGICYTQTETAASSSVVIEENVDEEPQEGEAPPVLPEDE